MLRNLLLGILLFLTSALAAQNQKLSYTTREILRHKSNNDSIDISISLMKGSSLPVKAHLLFKHTPSNSAIVRMKIDDLDELAKDVRVLFINAITIPKEELSTGAVDYSLNKINYIQTLHPELRGDSIRVSVKERLFDTTDIDLKGRVFKTGIENTEVTSHASLMSTIIAGAGNSSPFAKGAAPASLVTSANFINLLPDPDSIFQRYHITVQNHSYGTSVENFYGSEAAAYDVNALADPTLLHVFSAGNSGTTTNTSGPYANIAEMANLTGNFKHAKNIITVSAVDSINGLLQLSSKGPAYDGRVKPELVAYGEDGSSGAAALVSGAAVLVQDQYRKSRGSTPASHVTKAVLLNSADDVGNANVDYQSGYGSLNAAKAVLAVIDNRIIESSVQKNEVKTFNITIPSNTSKLKVTLVWNDPAALAGAAKALINDLDLNVQSSGTTWLPWVLSPVASKDSLLLPAQRKKDTLNNVEQVTIDNPSLGTYTINITGTKLANVSQAFAIAWQLDTAGVFKWTYPTKNDALVAGRTHIVRWETTNSGTGQLSYATSNANWRTVGSTDLSKPYFKWSLPDTVTTAVLKMSIAGTDYLSDTFTISRLPFLQAGFNCTDSFLVYWNRQGVQQFQLYELGEKYLQPVVATTDTFYVFSKIQHPSKYYAVAPIINNKTGLRSYTLNYTGANCYFRSFYLLSQQNNIATFFAELGTIYNVAEVALEKSNGGTFNSLKTLANPSATTFTFSDSALKRGENLYRFRIKLANGTIIYNPMITVYYTSDSEPVIVYPNPVAQSSSFSLIALSVGKYTWRLIDISGKIIKEEPINSTYSSISASSLARGMYIIQIFDTTQNQLISNTKLIIY